ncbi:hypothetical protein SPI_04959 [Niveomyces insectorum RCEF 264]|uniref:YAG7-like dimerisation domain-containing protein n=1 Tax=Niveomyces insectorum RCEF 264 TaxID=1081102 RepID=A0A167TTM6_9HYPO|nr:hypothetical protein SPI_04959 [Niveomyces insectorum RCEF 264]
MAAPSIQNPAASVESKSAKKKKAKAAERTASPAPGLSSEKASSVAANEANGDDGGEPPYLRELAKNIRNVNKKITNASKTDGIIAENKDKSLDELVALKIINADQKAQHLKKPALFAQLAQLEEQYNQLKKLDQDYRQRLATEKADVTQSLTEKFNKEKADAVRAAVEKATADAQKNLHDSFLILSQFLRLAAARRADDQNPQQDENLALEGVLLQVYSGDENGVATMLKLVEGVDETTKSVANEPLETTYAQVKAVSAAYAAPLYQAEEPVTDPTLANANLTEIESGENTPLLADKAAPLTNGHATEQEQTASTPHAENADVGNAAANAVGESQWDRTNDNQKELSMSQEWVEVPRDPAETETGLAATPAAAANKQSWADEQPENPPPVIAPAPATTAAAGNAASAEPNDGFHQVQRHNRGRGDREGGWRGGGRGGGYRGRGRGGDGRGRGRGRGGGGGANGGNGSGSGSGHSFRGPRRTEES